MHVQAPPNWPDLLVTTHPAYPLPPPSPSQHEPTTAPSCRVCNEQVSHYGVTHVALDLNRLRRESVMPASSYLSVPMPPPYGTQTLLSPFASPLVITSVSTHFLT